jgi:hypothetical protein
LRSALLPEEIDTPWQDILHKRWPGLKAVIEEVIPASGCSAHNIHRVWLTPRKALDKPSLDLVSRIFTILYGWPMRMGSITGDKLRTTNISFWIDQHITRSVEGALLTTTRPGIRPTLRRRTLPSEMKSHAGISNTMLFAMDFYVLSDAPGSQEETSIAKCAWLYSLCVACIKTLNSRFLDLHIDCSEAIEVPRWLSLVRHQRAANDSVLILLQSVVRSLLLHGKLLPIYRSSCARHCQAMRRW